MIKSGKQFSMAMNLKRAFCLASHRLNAILKHLDLPQYEALTKLRKAVHEKYAFAQALDSINPSLMEGMAIMFNRQTCLHADTTDPSKAWVPLMVLGRCKKGYMWIPRLNLRLAYEPGAIVYIRGHILPHEVEVWEGGQRVSVVYFTHQSLWDEFAMSCP
jgi:hypothetical protein